MPPAEFEKRFFAEAAAAEVVAVDESATAA
jgi:hypothetical protein